jgi:beta-1,3-galactosyltransferase 1
MKLSTFIFYLLTWLIKKLTISRFLLTLAAGFLLLNLLSLIISFPFFENNQKPQSQQTKSDTTKLTRINPVKTSSKPKFKYSNHKPPLDKQQLADLHQKTLQTTAGEYPNTFRHNIANIFTKKQPNNPHDYDLSLNPSTRFTECSVINHNPNVKDNDQSRLLLLVMVMVAAEFTDRRALIRHTWANTSLYKSNEIRVVFVVGLSRNPEINAQVKLEFDKYGDVIREDFQDSYFNITIKVIGAIKWSVEYCSHVEYILRINDDIVVNSRRLISFLKGTWSQLRDRNGSFFKNTFFGMILRHSFPIRNPKSKWFMPSEEYGYSARYLPYMEGSAFILSADLAFNLYNLSTFVYWPRFSTSMEVCLCFYGNI